MTNSKPNILYIMSDQHAASVMGCAGDKAALTPNLDRLAVGGTRFSRAYCPSPVCLPSRMSLLTGRRPHEQDCWSNDDVLDSARPTWLHGLGGLGYQPVLVGRMHAMGPDQLHGYTARPIGDHSSPWPGRRVGADMGSLKKTTGPDLVSLTKSGPGRSSYQALDIDVLAESVRQIKDHVANAPDKPFALTASFMLPHPPYVALPDDYEAARLRIDPPITSRISEDEHAWIKAWHDIKHLEQVTDESIMRARAAYWGLVAQLDRQVGTLLDTLDELGVMDNTLIVYLSDHGDHLGERGLFWKHTLYDESIRVPLIFHWPEKIPAGQVIDAPVELGGVGNTILELVGGSPLPNASMPSLKSYIDGNPPEQPVPVFSEYCVDQNTGFTGGLESFQRCIIKGRYKLIYHSYYETQLFDLSRDPREIKNLAKELQFAELVAELSKEVLVNWSVERIRRRIQERAADIEVLKNWAINTQPPEPIRWELRAEQNELNES